jgi:hypothetical protein
MAKKHIARAAKKRKDTVMLSWTSADGKTNAVLVELGKEVILPTLNYRGVSDIGPEGLATLKTANRPTRSSAPCSAR